MPLPIPFQPSETNEITAPHEEYPLLYSQPQRGLLYAPLTRQPPQLPPAFLQSNSEPSLTHYIPGYYARPTDHFYDNNHNNNHNNKHDYSDDVPLLLGLSESSRNCPNAPQILPPIFGMYRKIPPLTSPTTPSLSSHSKMYTPSLNPAHYPLSSITRSFNPLTKRKTTENMSLPGVSAILGNTVFSPLPGEKSQEMFFGSGPTSEACRM